MSTQYLILTKCTSRCLVVSLVFISKGMDWQRHLLGYDGQLFLHYWQN